MSFLKPRSVTSTGRERAPQGRGLLLSLAVLLLLLVPVAREPWGASGGAVAAAPSDSAWMSVFFFDVDQGDSTLFLGEEFALLIDAGRHDRSDVADHLRRVGVEFIDVFVLTHPHADHIGQCPAVMGNFAVGEVWMSGDVHTTLTFERCLDAVLQSDAGYHEPRAGEAYDVGPVRVEVLHPQQVTGDLNNGSVVLRIVYGDVAFLMTGDAEAEAEAEMVGRGDSLAADVLKLAHHGSRTSSTRAFIRAVNPVVAVYSAGIGNTYGHPHEQTLHTLWKIGATVYGTDRNGTVVVRTDGHELNVEVGRGGPVVKGRGPLVWAAGNGTKSSGRDAAAACGPGQVNVNAASEADLTRIIHVGLVMAARIVEERPYDSLDDLLRVSGIGEARLADIVAQGVACAAP